MPGVRVLVHDSVQFASPATVRWRLTGACLIGNGLPPKILMIKIWACFSGVNGIADDPHKHVFELTPEGGRGALIGRASQHRARF